MKVLITGADGVLGNNLVREILSRNYSVTVLIISEQYPTPGLDGLSINRMYGNILDKQIVVSAVSGHDYVIHAAASTQVYPARSSFIREVNIQGTINIIEACLQHQVKRLIHVGTANSFAPGSLQHPGNEEGTFIGYRYGLDYIDSKYEAQQMVLQAVQKKGLNALIVNPVFMIGPYDTKPSSGVLLLELYNGRIAGYAPGSKSYIPVKDAAVAITNAITLGENGQCYILSNISLRHKEALKMMAEIMGVKPPSLDLPAAIVKLAGVIASWKGKNSGRPPALTKELAVISCEEHCYSGAKAHRDLLMPYSDFRVAIAECFEWFVEHHYIRKKSKYID
jgi:dihydroflavonol-4-reductase